MTTYPQARWSLNDLLPGPGEAVLQTYLAELETCVSALESGRVQLSTDISSGEFLRLLGLYEQQSRVANRLSAYANLWFYEDTQNSAALNLRGRIDQTLAQAGNRTLFFTLWFKELPDETAEQLIDASGDRAYMLAGLRRFRPHTLSEAEERIINLKDVDGIDALVEIYDLVTNNLSFSLEIDGQRRQLTRDQLSAYFRSPVPELRAAAYQELLDVFADNQTLLAQIYVHRARDWHSEGIELRGFSQPISYRNLINDIPDEVVDTLLAVCRENARVFQRYFKLKAAWLGVEKLHRFDIYAPLAPSQKRFNYAQAVEMVLDSFHQFSPEVRDQVERVFKENHLDAENRPGKRGGAFCYSALPELTPWVLVNYAGQARDVATLAHELGHAVHAMQSAGHSILSCRPSLPLAETASVFSEMLLTERLLSSENDPAVRRDLLAHAIDDAFATVLRQAYFTLFELLAHQMIAEGRPVEDLCTRYYEGLVEQFGDAVVLTDDFRWEWISIPHIYKSPFYTYSYSFGQLLVLALFQQYKTLGAAFVPRYLKILAYGGAAAPADILAEAGIDMAAPSFWQGGFDVLEGMIDQLEEI
jgi:oligoendopeptidase F